MSYFKKYHNKISLLKSSDPENSLRNSQLGAIHSILAYFTLLPSKPGIITMPTGTGKTSVLIMATFLLEAQRVLVLTPSVFVRSQIAKEFETLKTLKKINVIKSFNKYPKVKQIVTEPKLASDLKDIYNHDAIISTPKTMYKYIEFGIEKNVFDLVLVDEAHHSSAETWKKTIDYFTESKIVFFTATPFRSDKKEIKGDIIYNYPLSLAYKEGIFGEIEYHPIYNYDESNKDLDIAKEAEILYKKDRQQGYEHYLFVRTNQKKHAEFLEELYEQHTSLKLARIDSSKTYSYINKIIDDLRSNKLDGVICVDMLGEGFDFPNLKIAAIHNPHKSLAVTLQFIGRFTRTNSENLGIAKFIAVVDEELILENKRLYENDAIWKDIIIDLSENKTQVQIDVKAFLMKFREVNEYENFKDELSIASLKPYFHVKIFRVQKFIQNAKIEILDHEVAHRFVDEDSKIQIIITKKLLKPKWTTDNNIFDVTYYLFVIYYDQKTGLLFINSPIKSEQFYTSLLSAFTEGNVTRISKSQLHRVLADLSQFEIFNTGLQNRYPDQGESYRILAGSNTDNAIDRTSGRMYSNGHVFCKAIDKTGTVTIGYSSASKVWSNKYGNIMEFTNWCGELALKIMSDVKVITNTNLDLIPISSPVKEFPLGIFSCYFHYEVYIRMPRCVIPEDGRVFDLVDLNMSINYDKTDTKKVCIKVGYEEIQFEILYHSDGTYNYSDPKLKQVILVDEAEERMDLPHFFELYSLQLMTINDSLISDHEIMERPNEFEYFKAENIIDVDWKAINVNIENEANGINSIQQGVEQELLKIPSLEVIIKDHGSGELADFLTIEETDNTITVQLFHVKASGGPRPTNNRVNDVYEVCSQAVKSMIWLNKRALFLRELERRTKGKDDKYIRGELKDVQSKLRSSKTVRYNIIIVQPGLTSSIELPEKIAQVLACSEAYLKNSGLVERYIIWGSS